MLVCALSLLAIALQEKREGLRRALPWLLMAAAFCALSLDEIATLHEGLSAALAARIDNSGLFYFAWTLPALALCLAGIACRSEEHTSELQSLMRISYAVFCLKKKKHL